MLDGSLLCRGHLPDANAVRNVPRHRDVLAFGFVNDGEIGIAGKCAVDLDEVGSSLLLLVYRPARLICSCHFDRVRPDRRLAINYRARKVDMRRDQMLCCQLRSKRVPCTCMSHRPGIRYLPLASTTFAAAAGLTFVLSLTSEIRSPAITTVWS